MADWRLTLGDCREVLPGIGSGSVDLVFTDPPYPCIQRSYGTWTEAEWWDLMRVVVPECMRVLKPTGSAVFVLQPNSERVGRMRTWLWEFMLWVGKTWGIVQDAWWHNPVVLPNGGATSKGMMRAAVKACVWVGPPNCYRNQEAVLLPMSARMARETGTTPYRLSERGRAMPSGNKVDSRRVKEAVLRRGGTTPFNLIRATKGGLEHRSASGMSAGIPLEVCSFWVRYLCPRGGETDGVRGPSVCRDSPGNTPGAEPGTRGRQPNRPGARPDQRAVRGVEETPRNRTGVPDSPVRMAGTVPGWPRPVVLDPFSGSATVGLAALAHGCRYAGIERVPEYHETARRRLADAQGPLFADLTTEAP